MYELVRLFVLAKFIGPGAEGTVFPWAAFGAANGLFLLMALFIWLDFGRYGVYAPLYTAGKVLAVVSAAGWCVFSRAQIINAIFMDESGILMALESLLAITAGDLLSAVGGAALSNKRKQLEAAERIVLRPEAAEAVPPVTEAAAERVIDEPAAPGNGGL
jgi:hypothetical protein